MPLRLEYRTHNLVSFRIVIAFSIEEAARFAPAIILTLPSPFGTEGVMKGVVMIPFSYNFLA